MVGSEWRGIGAQVKRSTLAVIRALRGVANSEKARGVVTKSASRIAAGLMVGVLSLSMAACQSAEKSSSITDQEVRTFASAYNAAVVDPSGAHREAPNLTDLTTLVDFKALTASVADATFGQAAASAGTTAAVWSQEFAAWSASHTDQEMAAALVANPLSATGVPKSVESLLLLTNLMLMPVSDSGAGAAERDLAQQAGGEFTTTISVLPPGDRVQLTLTQDTVVFAPGDTSGVRAVLVRLAPPQSSASSSGRPQAVFAL